jgi:hypothetical protein
VLICAIRVISGEVCCSTVLAFLLAGYALFRKQLPLKQLDFAGGLTKILKPIRLLHSGSMCDYVAWMTFGVALLGGLFALFIH